MPPMIPWICKQLLRLGITRHKSSLERDNEEEKRGKEGDEMSDEWADDRRGEGRLLLEDRMVPGGR